jgi:integrase
MRTFNLPGISHHTMRHTGVTIMLDEGISPRAIQQLVGWTTLRMVERYGHVRDSELRRAVGATRELICAALSPSTEQSQNAKIPLRLSGESDGV